MMSTYICKHFRFRLFFSGERTIFISQDEYLIKMDKKGISFLLFLFDIYVINSLEEWLMTWFFNCQINNILITP